MRRLASIVAVLVLLVAAAAAAGGWIWYQRAHEPFKGDEAEAQIVDIPPGASTKAIAESLAAAGVVRDVYLFRSAVWWTNASRRLKAGEYRFAEPASVLDVIRTIERGDVYAVRVTFPEGLTIAEMAEVFADRGLGTAAAFTAAAGQTSLVADLDSEATDLEGYLFPATYAVARRGEASALVATMVGRFRQAYTPELQAKATSQGMSTRKVVALASLIEEETARADERPLVSAVYRNRLRIGMGMQADPTVVYALKRAGKYTGNIRRDDLRVDSPYNTYRYPGLPPGPIASPGQRSLEAALAPADVDYLYFVSRNDGSHVFAKTLREHNANVNEFQVRYFQRARTQRQAATPNPSRSTD
jgi:UPF0755 protein